MIKVNSQNCYGTQVSSSFDADAFECSNGFLILRKRGEAMACFALGYWSSVEKTAEGLMLNMDFETAGKIGLFEWLRSKGFEVEKSAMDVRGMGQMMAGVQGIPLTTYVPTPTPPTAQPDPPADTTAFEGYGGGESGGAGASGS